MVFLYFKSKYIRIHNAVQVMSMYLCSLFKYINVLYIIFARISVVAKCEFEIFTSESSSKIKTRYKLS